MRGVGVTVFRSDLGDCTHGGVSSPQRARGKTLVVFDEALSGGKYRLDECRDDPQVVCLVVVRRRLQGREYMHLEPLLPEGSGHPAFGGNYGGGFGSDFHALNSYPLPIHDRWETP